MWPLDNMNKLGKGVLLLCLFGCAAVFRISFSPALVGRDTLVVRQQPANRPGPGVLDIEKSANAENRDLSFVQRVEESGSEDKNNQTDVHTVERHREITNHSTIVTTHSAKVPISRTGEKTHTTWYMAVRPPTQPPVAKTNKTISDAVVSQMSLQSHGPQPSQSLSGGIMARIAIQSQGPQSQPSVSAGAPSRFRTSNRYQVEISTKAWFAIITPHKNRFASRVANVDRMQQMAPFIEVFNASLGADQGCRAFLRKQSIRVSPAYWAGGGTISAGKVGHWCSFLRFIDECHRRRQNVTACVWIEDDVSLSRSDMMKLVKVVETAKFSVPILRAGISGDLINIFDPNRVEVLLNHVASSGIYNPTDVLFNGIKMAMQVAKIGRMLDMDNHSGASLIRTMPMLDIRTFNDEVHRQPAHQSQVVQHLQSYNATAAMSNSTSPFTSRGEHK